MKTGGLSVPVALPDEPTTQVVAPVAELETVRVVWQRVDETTSRLTFERHDVPDDVSDGIPRDQPCEISSTTRLSPVDVADAFDLVVEFARRDRVPLSLVRSRVLDTAKFSYAQACDDTWVVQLTGQERVQNQVAGAVLMLPDWTLFQEWFPRVLGEVEGYLFRMFDPRKSLAMTFALRAFARDLPSRQVPGNHGIIRL